MHIILLFLVSIFIIQNEPLIASSDCESESDVEGNATYLVPTRLEDAFQSLEPARRDLLSKHGIDDCIAYTARAFLFETGYQTIGEGVIRPFIT